MSGKKVRCLLGHRLTQITQMDGGIRKINRENQCPSVSGKKVRYLLGRRLTQITQIDGVVRKAISEISVHQCQEKKLGVY